MCGLFYRSKNYTWYISQAYGNCTEIATPKHLGIFNGCWLFKELMRRQKLPKPLCTLNPRNVMWTPLKFWNIVKDFSINFSDLLTTKYVPIQLKFLPRNGKVPDKKFKLWEKTKRKFFRSPEQFIKSKKQNYNCTVELHCRRIPNH